MLADYYLQLFSEYTIYGMQASKRIQGVIYRKYRTITIKRLASLLSAQNSKEL